MFFFENFFRLKKKIFDDYKINLSYNINFGSKKANNFFREKLKKAIFYFEYGSGNSTLLVDKYKKKFISIELDKKFYQIVCNNVKRKKNIKLINMGPVGEFSYPIFKNKKKIIEYIQSINIFFKKKDYPDLILVDGRFRVACCINIYFLIKKFNKYPLIILDDYKKRKYYKVLNRIFDIKKCGRMAILEVKKKKIINEQTLNEFIFDSR